MFVLHILTDQDWFNFSLVMLAAVILIVASIFLKD